jgi:hypothetical protein
MKASPGIIHGGGWITQQDLGRPRARFFAGASFLYLWVSAFASLPFWDGWPKSLGIWEWLCCALVVPQLILPLLAVVFWFAERPGIIVVDRRNPERDLRKLY